MNRRAFTALAALAMMMVGGVASASGNDARVVGVVYTMSNAPSGNAVLMFDQMPNGALVAAGAVPTGGLGTGGGLGNQGAVVLSRSERWLFAVNPGSDQLSVFDVRRRALRLVDVVPSGGLRPVSVTEHRGLVYVLNGLSDSIAGFRQDRHGALTPIPGSTRSLSGVGTGPAQISFTPDGRVLVVTEKNTNRIVTFTVDRHGRPDERRVLPSQGGTPFGFAFTRRDQLFVSEAFGGAADASALSSYDVDRDGSLQVISASVPTGETAACWVVITPGGRFAYLSNTGSGSISGYSIDAEGAVTLLTPDGRTGVTGDGTAPIDMVLSDNGRFLYVLNSATQEIAAFRVESSGQLSALPSTGGLPVGANGLAAR